MSAARLLVSSLLLALGACASLPRQRVLLPEPRLAPAAMAMDASLVQRLQFTRGDGRTEVLEAQLEVDAVGLRLAAFALGRRVLWLDWDGARLDEQRAPQLPESVSAAPFLRDLQFAFAPAPTLQAALPPGWQLREDGQRRELWHGGASAMVIAYATMPRWQGTVTLDNRIEGYRLRIETATVDGNPD
ncbi:MAG: DUF3261 domain-containing protein [Xanthomonadales bacterium]|nr:DUF3261 domain-containing protein [Xanthomonadales bacterium]